MRKTIIIGAMASAFLLSSCAQNNGMSNENAGTVIGGIAGGLAGLAFGKGSGKAVAVLAGAGIGALIGNRIGANLDEREKQAMAAATQHAAEAAKTNEKVAWSAPVESDASARPAAVAVSASATPQAAAPLPAAKPKARTTANGWVIPKSDPYQKNGRTCRDMTQVAVKEGQEMSDDVTLCREVASNGAVNWVIPKT